MYIMHIKIRPRLRLSSYVPATSSIKLDVENGPINERNLYLTSSRDKDEEGRDIAIKGYHPAICLFLLIITSISISKTIELPICIYTHTHSITFNNPNKLWANLYMISHFYSKAEAAAASLTFSFLGVSWVHTSSSKSHTAMRALWK